MTDAANDALAAILGLIVARLEAASAPVCRAFVAPGGMAPWDACCGCRDAEGQAWTLAERVYPADPFPLQDTGAQRCRPTGYAADVVAAALRCAHTVDDHGTAPPASVVTADAEKVGRDRRLIRDALLCDWLDADSDPGVFRLGEWTPLGPQGGCVGGMWRVTLALPAEACPD